MDKWLHKNAGSQKGLERERIHGVEMTSVFAFDRFSFSTERNDTALPNKKKGRTKTTKSGPRK